MEDDKTGLKNLYHKSCQFVSVIELPAAVIIALFAPEILQMWTGNPLIASEIHMIASVLVVGATLNPLMNMPYALQLANGWTKLAFYQNLVSIIVLEPGIILLTERYGMIGAAIIWVLLNSGYVFITVQLMYRRLLRGEQRQWHLVDVGLPFIGALIVRSLGRLWFHQCTSNLIVFID
jgi:O-antigen/teichoic acid export membrane protein